MEFAHVAVYRESLQKPLTDEEQFPPKHSAELSWISFGPEKQWREGKTLHRNAIGNKATAVETQHFKFKK